MWTGTCSDLFPTLNVFYNNNAPLLFVLSIPFATGKFKVVCFHLPKVTLSISRGKLGDKKVKERYCSSPFPDRDKVTHSHYHHRKSIKNCASFHSHRIVSRDAPSTSFFPKRIFCFSFALPLSKHKS
jgi:hypothetical protein